MSTLTKKSSSGAKSSASLGSKSDAKSSPNSIANHSITYRPNFEFHKNEPMLFTDDEIKKNTNTDLWDMFRMHMKKEQDLNRTMFLYGKPTEKIMTIITRLYHENILRIQARTNASLPTRLHKFMSGVLELDNGTILVTISEDPEETSFFDEKKRELCLMLTNSNCPISIFKADTKEKPTPLRNNYLGAGHKIPIELFRGISSYLITDDKLGPVGESKDKASNDYSKSVREETIPVFFVNSNDYLKRRREKHVSFIPFKKDALKLKPGTEEVESRTMSCNNGSTCVESKLFSFIHDRLKLDYRAVKGFVSYWIGDKMPPAHIIPSYCYEEKVDEYENTNLFNLTAKCFDSYNERFKTIFTQLEENGNHNIIKYIANPCSVPCPGCVNNWQAYLQNNYIKWNYSECAAGRRRFNEDYDADPLPAQPSGLESAERKKFTLNRLRSSLKQKVKTLRTAKGGKRRSRSRSRRRKTRKHNKKTY